MRIKCVRRAPAPAPPEYERAERQLARAVPPFARARDSFRFPRRPGPSRRTPAPPGDEPLSPNPRPRSSSASHPHRSSLLAVASARTRARVCGWRGPARRNARRRRRGRTSTRCASRSPPPRIEPRRKTKPTPPPRTNPNPRELPTLPTLSSLGRPPRLVAPRARLPTCARHAAQINLDVERTFPSHPDFRLPEKGAAGGNGRRLEPLRRVLMALAHAHPDVGYTQGMNFIAGWAMLALDASAEGGDGRRGRAPAPLHAVERSETALFGSSPRCSRARSAGTSSPAWRRCARTWTRSTWRSARTTARRGRAWRARVRGEILLSPVAPVRDGGHRADRGGAARVGRLPRRRRPRPARRAAARLRRGPRDAPRRRENRRGRRRSRGGGARAARGARRECQGFLRRVRDAPRRDTRELAEAAERAKASEKKRREEHARRGEEEARKRRREAERASRVGPRAATDAWRVVRERFAVGASAAPDAGNVAASDAGNAALSRPALTPFGNLLSMFQSATTPARAAAGVKPRRLVWGGQVGDDDDDDGGGGGGGGGGGEDASGATPDRGAARGARKRKTRDVAATRAGVVKAAEALGVAIAGNSASFEGFDDDRGGASKTRRGGAAARRSRRRGDESAEARRASGEGAAAIAARAARARRRADRAEWRGRKGSFASLGNSPAGSRYEAAYDSPAAAASPRPRHLASPLAARSPLARMR